MEFGYGYVVRTEHTVIANLRSNLNVTKLDCFVPTNDEFM